MVDINVLGLLYCAHAAIPHLLSAAENAPRNVADTTQLHNMTLIGTAGTVWVVASGDRADLVQGPIVLRPTGGAPVPSFQIQAGAVQPTGDFRQVRGFSAFA